MRDWLDARERVVALQATDPQQAETLNAQISEDYGKQYTDTQSREEAQLTQLDAIHQQHVQTNLNYRKRLSMQKLMGELRADNYKVSRVLVIC